MADEKDGPSSFRVVDRRSFTPEGARRADSRAEEAKSAPSPAAQPPEPKPESEESFEAEGAGFDTLVSYLRTTAIFQLGLMAGPGGERIPADMPNARRTIDLLEVLQHKTEGNLTPDESQFLEDVLYELRLAFVELEKRQARKGK